MNHTNMQKMLQQNKWLIIVILFFIFWKFFLIHTMWQGRNITPEPRDSFVYIAHINSVIQCNSFLFCEEPYSLNNFWGYEHLTYRLFFGTIGKALNLSAQQTYHYSFYIGTLLLIPTLLYFTKKLTSNKSLQILILFFLALYNGGSSYHGFFWVVPTFFSVLLFFLMMGIVLDNKIKKHWIYTLPLLASLASLTHLISIYAVSIFIFYVVIDSLINKNINWLRVKKITLLLIIFTISYVYLNFFLQDNPLQTVDLIVAKDILTVSATAVVNSTSTITSTDSSLINSLLPGFNFFIVEYIDWILPNFLGVIFFIVIISTLLYYKQQKILTLYISAFLFTIISTRSIYGIRALVFLWPITFILYAYGAYYIFTLITKIRPLNKKTNTFLVILYSLGILSFVIINMSYSYFLNEEKNHKHNIYVPTNRITVLPATHHDKVYCTTTVIKLYPSNSISASRCNAKNISESDTFVTFIEKTSPSHLQKIIAIYKNKNAPKGNISLHDKIPAGFHLHRQLGDILIYKRN